MVDIPMAQNAQPCDELAPLTAAMKPLKFAWTPEGLAIFCEQHENGMAVFISRAETLPRDLRRFAPTTLTLEEMNVIYETANAVPDQMGLLGCELNNPLEDPVIALGTAGPLVVTADEEDVDRLVEKARTAGVFQRCVVVEELRPKADCRFLFVDTSGTRYGEDGLKNLLNDVVSGGTLMFYGADDEVAKYDGFFEKAGAPLTHVEGTRLWSVVKP